jgi:hypothetical protein
MLKKGAELTRQGWYLGPITTLYFGQSWFWERLKMNEKFPTSNAIFIDGSSQGIEAGLPPLTYQVPLDFKWTGQALLDDSEGPNTLQSSISLQIQTSSSAIRILQSARVCFLSFLRAMLGGAWGWERLEGEKYWRNEISSPRLLRWSLLGGFAASSHLQYAVTNSQNVATIPHSVMHQKARKLYIAYPPYLSTSSSRVLTWYCRTTT